MINENKLNEWMKAKEKLDIAKKVELALRLSICESMFNGREGSFKIEQKDESIGRVVKATSKVNRNVDWEGLGFDKDEFQKEASELLKDYLDELSDLEISLIDIKISLNESRYKKTELEAETINECLTVTPGTPTLEVKFKD